MKHFAIAALLAALPNSLLADDLLLRQFGALPASLDQVPSGETVLALVVSGEIATPAHRRWPASGRVQGDLRRVVSIDGTMMDVEENWLRDRIADGSLTVVYPGTRTPVTEGSAAPAYPPAWTLSQVVAQTNG